MSKTRLLKLAGAFVFVFLSPCFRKSTRKHAPTKPEDLCRINRQYLNAQHLYQKSLQLSIAVDGTNSSQLSYAVAIELATTANISGVTISKNRISDVRGGANTSLTGSAGKANNRSGGGIGVGFSTANHDFLNVTVSNNTINNITAHTADFNNGGKVHMIF